MRLTPLLATLVLATALTPAWAAALPHTKASLAPLAPNAEKPIESHRALPLAADEARFSGEIGTRVVPLYLLPHEAARRAKVKLTYVSAVSVMPEASRVTISVNDVVLGERNLRSSGRPETLTFDVPAGVLAAGFNAVRFSVHHAHRVDCSRDASYELWTQIIPEQSGLVFGGARAEIRGLRDLPAVSPDRDGRIRIRARASAGVDAATLARYARAVQAAVVLGRYANPVVEIDPEDSGAPGLDLVVDTEAAVASLLGSRASEPRPRVQVQHDLKTDRVLVVVAGATTEDVDAVLQALEQAAAAVKPVGSRAGLRSLYAAAGLPVAGGEILPASSLGLATQRFAGRYYRQSALLQMPADFFPGDYGRIVLKLDAAYGSGLLPTSRINVRVNGAVVGTVPLHKREGETFSKRPVDLPLSALKPGVNAIDIEADTATERDVECSPVAQMQQRDRLVIAHTSELEVPRLARIATFPSLSGVLTGSLGMASRGGAPLVFLPNPGRETMEAALGFVAKSAAVSGRVVPVAFTFERPGEAAAHVLTIGALADVPPSLLEAAGLDPDALQSAWRGAQAREPDLQASTGRIRVAAANHDWLMYPQSLATWSSDRGAEDPEPAGREPLGQAVDGAEDDLVLSLEGEGRQPAEPRQDAWQALRSALPADVVRFWPDRAPASATDVVTPGASLVVAQGASPSRRDAGWRLLPEIASSTVFVAPTAELLQSSMTDLLTTGRWQQLAGSAAAFDRSEGAVRSAEPTQSPFLVATQALTPGNLRLIMAGWLSHHVGVYLAALAGIVALLTALTYRGVRSSGVQA